MKNNFRDSGFIFALFIFTTLFLQAQNQDVDVIYLKNGKTISGKIVERIPDKTIVIETKEGIEFVDVVDIKRIQKEVISKIEGIAPLSGEAGSTLTLTGSFPPVQPMNTIVFIGKDSAEILLWEKNKIDVRVPNVEANDYVIVLQTGDQKDIARIAYSVIFKNERVRPLKKSSSTPQLQQRQQSQKQQALDINDEAYNLGGFWMILGYTIPLGDFAKTDFLNGGYAKKGFSVGFEGRIHLSRTFYIPLNFQVSYLGYNIEELQKQASMAISSEGKSHGIIWLTIGLGFAINVSPTTYFFASSDIGGTMVHRPDIQFGSPFAMKYNSVNTFTAGHGFQGGITFTDDVCFGYRMFISKPKHKVPISYSNSSQTNEFEIEQQSNVGMIFMSISW